MKKNAKDTKYTDTKAISHFLYEVGTLRKIARAHRQTLLTDDVSDNIASHSYRVALVGWFLANMEGVDPYKVAMMGLLHDLAEARSGDHNWVHKKYVKIFEDEIMDDQLGALPDNGALYSLAKEYGKRESREAKIAKDADLLDQILLLKEYIHQGNKEAAKWLVGKKDDPKLFSHSARELAKELCEQEPGQWWEDIWTDRNR